MSEQAIIETIDLECNEQGRTAHLLVEWTSSRQGRQLVAVQCDNPRFASLVPWDCGWACWSRVQEQSR